MECHIVKLPNELLDRIATCSASLRDTAALAHSCKRMTGALTPVLYKLDATSIFPRALMWSAVRGRAEVAEKALKAGTDANTLCDAMLHEPFLAESPFSGPKLQESTPLLLAAAFGHLGIAATLLGAGANGRWMDRHLRTALHWAALSGHADMVELLLEHAPATRHAEEYRRLKPAEYALDAGHTQIFKRLAEAGPLSDHLQYLCHAASVGNDASFRWLLARRPQFDGEPWKYWMTKSLAAACRGDADGHVRVVETILKNCKQDCNLSTDLTSWAAASSCKTSAGPRMLRLLFEYAGTSLTKHILEHDATQYHAPGSESEFEKDTAKDVFYGLVLRACDAKNAESLRVILRNGASTAINRFVRDNECAIRRICSDAACLDLIFGGDAGSTLLASQTGRVAFSGARESGNDECARLLLSRGVNLEATYGCELGVESFAPVWASALEKGCFPAVHCLKRLGLAADLTNAQWLNLLQDVQEHVEEASPELMMEKLIAQNPNATGTEGWGKPPLHRCCELGWSRCAQMLLDAGADMNGEDDDGVKPLHLAVFENNFQTVQLLLRAGADVDARTSRRATPLLVACAQIGVTNKGMATFLMEQGANTGLQDETGATPLHAICSATFDDPTEALELMRSLIKRGANVDAVAQRKGRLGPAGWETEPCTPLLTACYLQNVAAAKCLLEHGADPAPFPGLTTSTLSIAVEKMNAQLVGLLLSYGQDPNAPDEKGETPLHLAFRSGGSYHVLKLLLDHNLKNDMPPSLPAIKLRQRAGFTPFHFPAELNQPLLLELLLELATSDELGLDLKTAHHLAELGANNAIRIFVERGIVDPAKKYRGRTLLEAALEFRKFTVSAYLRSLKEGPV